MGVQLGFKVYCCCQNSLRTFFCMHLLWKKEPMTCLFGFYALFFKQWLRFPFVVKCIPGSGRPPESQKSWNLGSSLLSTIGGESVLFTIPTRALFFFPSKYWYSELDACENFPQNKAECFKRGPFFFITEFHHLDFERLITTGFSD